MPPRYAYWTILIDGQATAFRAREREELLPTFNQLARKNTNIVMRYFARGRLWDSPEQAQWANRNPAPRSEPRNREWRPGGQHKDPRARFGDRAGRAGKAGWAGKAGGAGKAERAGQAGGATGGGWRGKPGAAGKPERRPRFEERSDKLEQRGPRQPRVERPKSFGRPKWQGRSEEQGKPESGDRPNRKLDARDEKRPGRWNRPPKRKPR
jgi:hypothetical protein